MTVQSFYAMEKKSGRGVPIFLNAVLAEEYNQKNPMPDMDYEWNFSSGIRKVNFPDHLFLICNERLLIFDYYPHFDGFIVSNEFLKVFRGYSSMEGYQLVPLETLSWKGKKITEKKYYYLFPYKEEDWVDFQASKYVVEKGETVEDIISTGGLFIKKIEKIILKEPEIDKEVFTLRGSTLTNYLFCSEIFKKEIEKEKLVSIDFIPLEQFPDYYNKKNLL
ncbi:Imm43 family immunity protein [Paenibacillus durus]|uniref:Immunity protein 43 domain-containing protein n=1 Tax=Paenibacillus durus TaxID=44251 RepID=A0A089HTU2_PAEDU|nr:Imm43 family immunity protein [Paenibacillus durus]AIQ13783.1 hypothetical protein PDUR_19075 [Paenibacillus durus]